VVQGDAVSVYYDPMIAKLIVWGDTRRVALARMTAALRDYHIVGLKTNVQFVADLTQTKVRATRCFGALRGIVAVYDGRKRK
jgi:3-methylcrotonyl-CoA carboxylase alpha subunit